MEAHLLIMDLDTNLDLGMHLHGFAPAWEGQGAVGDSAQHLMAATAR